MDEQQNEQNAVIESTNGQVDGKTEEKQSFKQKFAAARKKNGGAWQAFKYLLCTASAGLIELISFTILDNVLPLVMNPHETITFITTVAKTNFIATTVALALSVLWNFTLNRKITFKSAANVPKAMFLAFLFYVPFYPFKIWFNGVLPGIAVASAAATAGVTAAAYLLSHSAIKTVFEIISMLCNGVLEFCWQKFFIYRKSQNTAGKGTGDEDDVLKDFNYDEAA